MILKTRLSFYSKNSLPMLNVQFQLAIIQLFIVHLGALSKDKSIKICKQDKRNGLVILNSNEYFKKLDEIILDQTKFVEVVPKRKSNIYPLISRETSIGKYIKKCLKQFKSETV